MAAQDISANLNWTAQRNGTGGLDALMIEKFNNVVHERLQFASITDGVFARVPLVGTDTMSNAAFSDPTLQAVVAGVEPLGVNTKQGDRLVQVKTPIIARVVEGALSRVQDRLNIQGRMPGAFARVIAKAIDEIQLHKCVQSALATSGAGALAELQPGRSVTEAALDDYKDATKLEKMFRDMMVLKMQDEVMVDEGLFYVTPEIYGILLDNDKLVSRYFSENNGSFSDAQLLKASGFKIKPTNRLPTTANASHIMGTDYNVSAAEAKTLACWAAPEAIMSAESIPLTSDAYWDQRLLTWFVDSYLAFGTGIDNPAYAGVILKT
jgi:hypothetical protein